MAKETLIETDKDQEDRWQIESDARSIKEFFELKKDIDRFAKAIKELEKEESAIVEAVKETTAYKESIGFKKK